MPGGPGGDMRDADIKIEKFKTTRETLYVAGQKYNCLVKSFNGVVTVGSITVTIPVKEWTHKSIPVTGMVKSEISITGPGGDTITITQMLTSFNK